MEKQELINVIGREIDFAQKNESRPGWTQWALMVVIAGLFWRLLIQIQQGNIYWNSIATWFFIGVIMWDTLILLRAFLLRSNSSTFFGHEKTKSRFSSPLEFSLGIGLFIPFLFRTILVFFLIAWLYIPLGTALLGFILLYYFGISSAFIISYALDVFDFPVSKKRPPMIVGRALVVFFVFVCTIFIISTYLLLVNMDYGLFWVNNVQVAFILLGMLYLVSLYLSIARSPDLLLVTLKNIERDLIFGYMDPKTAQEQVDTILHGRKADHFLQGYANDIVLLAEERNKYQNKINLLLTEALEAKGDSAGMVCKIGEAHSYFDKIESIDNIQIPKIINKFILKIYILSIVDSSAWSNSSSLMDKVQDLNRESMEAMESNLRKLRELETKIEQTRMEHTPAVIEHL